MTGVNIASQRLSSREFAGTAHLSALSADHLVLTRISISTEIYTDTADQARRDALTRLHGCSVRARTDSLIQNPATDSLSAELIEGFSQRAWRDSNP
jgi:hypothetical protein